MKLLRVGAAGEERPAVRTDDGRLLDLSCVASD
ncbi:2-hydroxyhepta-2,4-diene-1,7-dioate isomerase, partial [Streptomyces sp. NY05-11A]|nr:2-hydroxyhepta-2,4-diene-1,7-dioate isomerase [Streptomyces sp. NY05-11A]